MSTTKPNRSKERYESPALVARGSLVGLTRETSEIGENDTGMPPLDCFEPAGSGRTTATCSQTVSLGFWVPALIRFPSRMNQTS